MNNINFEKIFTKKHHYWRNLLIILVAVVVISGIWYIYQGQVKSSDNTEPENDIAELCKGFSASPNEISCEDAIETALNEYLGKISSIKKTTIELIPEDMNQTVKYTIWLIKMNFEEPISMPGIDKVEEVEVGVDRFTKELFLLSYGGSTG
jgi:hypothetical protein